MAARHAWPLRRSDGFGRRGPSRFGCEDRARRPLQRVDWPHAHAIGSQQPEHRLVARHVDPARQLQLLRADFIDRAAVARRRIVVSSVSLAEIVYLVEKDRLPVSAYNDLKDALLDPNHVLKEATFTVDVVDAMRQVPRLAVPDMPDRIIAATAVHFGVPVISRDRRIQSSAIQTIW